MNSKPLVSKWVSNLFVTVVIVLFACIMMLIGLIAYLQVGVDGQYAAEYTGMLNNFMVFFLGTIVGGVIGVLYNIKPEDMQKLADVSVKTSKDIGLSAVAEQHDKLQESPKVDDENN